MHNFAYGKRSAAALGGLESQLSAGKLRKVVDGGIGDGYTDHMMQEAHVQAESQVDIIRIYSKYDVSEILTNVLLCMCVVNQKVADYFVFVRILLTYKN